MKKAQRRIANSVQRTGKRCMRKGFTLPEMLVTIGVVAIVAAVALPAFYAIRDSYNSSGADTLISAALSTAKAMAAKEQKYVGVRFQCVPNPENPVLPGEQYLVFIVHDPIATGWADGFRAANGVAPIKLPVNQGVMDLYIKDNYNAATPKDQLVADDADLSEMRQLWDTTTFSIVFSPAGRLVTHEVRVRNKDGKADDSSEDAVFNSKDNVNLALQQNPTIPSDKTGKGMFYQDYDIKDGLGQETSRKSFVIYDRRDYRKVSGSPYSRYIKRLSENEQLYINPYTGTVIENQNRRNAMK